MKFLELNVGASCSHLEGHSKLINPNTNLLVPSSCSSVHKRNLFSRLHNTDIKSDCRIIRIQ